MAASTTQLCLVTLALLALAHSACSQKSVLVLLQDINAQDSYSSFFDSLTSSGFTLDIKGYKHSSLKLREYGVWLYDHLILFAPKAEGFGGSVDARTILDFVDSGHNVLLAANSDASENTRALASEFGVDLDDKGAKVFDHFNYAIVEGTVDHTLIAAVDVISSTRIAGEPLKAPVLYRGTASTVSAENGLGIVVLSAPATAYSHDPRKSMVEPPTLLVGNAAALVSVVQARNNARMLVSGSTDMFTNEFFDAEITVNGKTSKTANKAFCVSAALWTLQNKGVIKAENMRHHLIGSDDQPGLYRVNDDVEFLIDIFEYDGDKKLPYKADDLQVEFVMLDPYIRAALPHNNEGTFSLRFKVPDVYGVFKYVIEYKHLGVSYIKLTEQVPVRPFRHDEYERFLVCAYPYYASALSSMLAFFALGFFFLYHK